MELVVLFLKCFLLLDYFQKRKEVLLSLYHLHISSQIRQIVLAMVWKSDRRQKDQGLVNR